MVGVERSSKTSMAAQLLQDNSKLSSEFKGLQSQVCDAILAALLLLGVPALFASFFKALDFEQLWSVAIQAVALGAMALVLALRRRIPFKARALTLLFAIYALGVVGWLSYGHIGGGKLFLLVFILLTSIFFGFRASLGSMALAMVTLGLIGYIHVSGLVEVNISANDFHKAISPWVTAAFTVVLFGGFIACGIAVLLRAQLDTLRLLKERELFLDTVIDQSSALFLVLDLDLTVQNYNERAGKTFFTGKTRVIGENVSALLDNETGAKRLLNRLTVAAETQTGAHIEIQHMVAGVIKDFVWDITPLRSDEEKTVGLICLAQDVTGLRRAQRRLDQQTRLTAMGEMTTSIAHELNQPLSVIRLAVGGLLKTIRKSIEGSSSLNLTKVQTKLTRIDDHVERAANITDHMRQFGSDDQGIKEEFALGDALSNIRSLKDSIYGVLGINLQLDTAVYDIRVVGCRSDLEQSLLIILSNAEMAVRDLNSGEQKWISIEVKEETQTCSIFVIDSGKGVIDSELPHVFDPFFSTRATGEGTGLGLSLARKLMTEMGGSIDLPNSSTGGACVHLQLPSADNPADV